MVREKERYHTLDAIRGIAAILVAFYHFRVRSGEPNIVGYLAVDLFFVLSGFVIALNYEALIKAGLGATQFMILRLIRLYPLYFAGWVIGVVGVLVARYTGQPGAVPAVKFALAALCNLLTLPTPFQNVLFPLNGPSWSLFFEILVNVLFAIGLARARSGVLFLLAVCSAAYLASTLSEVDLLNVGWNWGNALGGLARTTLSFSSGMLIFRHFHPHKRETWLSVVPVILSIAAIVGGAFWPSHVMRELLTVWALFPLAVTLAARWDLPLILQPSARFVGDISYALYVVHWPLIAIMWPLLERLEVLPANLLYLATALFLSLALVNLYDGPLRKRLTRIYKSRASLGRSSS